MEGTTIGVGIDSLAHSIQASPNSSFFANLPLTRGRLSARVFRQAYCVDYCHKICELMSNGRREASHFEARLIER